MDAAAGAGDKIPADSPANPAADAFTPVFRAVGTPRQRRGIRLETIYWDTLKAMAAASGSPVGQMVEATIDKAPQAANLASALRVEAMRWLRERVERLEALTGLDRTGAIVQASPSPAFALTQDKRILLYNAAFLHLVQSRFLGERPDVMRRGLRFSLDTQLHDVIETLRQGGVPAVSSGFVLGVEEQRIRGTLNMVLAPVHGQVVVIAFVSRV